MGSKLHIGGTVLENLHLGGSRINKIYLGDILIYEDNTEELGYVIYMSEDEKIQTYNVIESYDSSSESLTLNNITINYDNSNEKIIMEERTNGWY